MSYSIKIFIVQSIFGLCMSDFLKKMGVTWIIEYGRIIWSDFK